MIMTDFCWIDAARRGGFTILGKPCGAKNNKMAVDNHFA